MPAKTENTKPRVVNGINVDDLLALIEGVRRDAAEGNTQWRVNRAQRAAPASCLIQVTLSNTNWNLD